MLRWGSNIYESIVYTEEEKKKFKKSQEKGTDLEKKILSDITVHMKYARYDDEKNRRENWE